ncbi:MAG: tRNA (cytidine(34)-2'-O)-methyltransferase [Cohaesibacter sp.]|nr:tRNA (cytidine(34)-2'-O)-methyltransferase [Cohaesibacter sp.]MCV6603560.1 tRNA (cytidine(34)-2'-O)-methyltransferase [Cohaesibacter sp.]
MTETASKSQIAIALYQPDIPQNTGTILRMAACLNLHVHIIEPCGFALNDRTLRRAGMDYLDRSTYTKHLSWSHFVSWAEQQEKRLVLATTKASKPFLDISYQSNDILLFGRESVGVPDEVHERADARITIPMREGERSLNLAISTAMLASEALRQLKAFPS